MFILWGFKTNKCAATCLIHLCLTPDQSSGAPESHSHDAACDLCLPVTDAVARTGLFPSYRFSLTLHVHGWNANELRGD